MEDKFNEWIGEVDGRAIEAEDASNYAQCFDLAFNWCDKLSIPRDSIRHLYAYQIFTQPNPDTEQYWNLVVNTPTNVPTVGALMVWGTTVGKAGHVSTFKEGDQNSFRSEDQNWAGIQKAKLVNHSYNGVLGWLQPKSAVITQPTPQPVFKWSDQVKIPANLLGTTEDMEIQAIRGKLGDLERLRINDDQTQKALTDANTQILLLKTQVQALQSQIEDLKNQLVLANYTAKMPPLSLPVTEVSNPTPPPPASLLSRFFNWLRTGK